MAETQGDQGEGAFFALIGDIVGSRALENRAAVQRRLRELLEEQNEALGPDVLPAPLKLTAGDEVQALLGDGAAAVRIVVGLADRLHPVRITWGLGRGALTTDLEPDVSVLDGPCFHRARAALEKAVRDDAWLRVEGIVQPHERVLNALFRLMGAIRSRWTEVQAQYVRAVRGRLQKDVAREFGVSEPAVSKALTAAQFGTLEEGEEAVERLLRWLVESGGAEPNEGSRSCRGRSWPRS